jgi:hypothetical protein
MTNKELQFALDKALEIAKGKEEQIKYLVNRMELLKELHGKEIKKLKAENQRLINNNMVSESMINTISKHKGAKLRYEVETDSKDVLIITDHPLKHTGGFTEIKQSSYRNPSVGIQEPDHTTAKLTISAIIGIAAGFILALMLL